MILFIRKLPNKRKGFTILELMVATMVFSVILLVIAVGVLRFTHEYYKGVNSTKTQNMARSIIAELAQSIQFSKTVVPIPADASGVGGFCVDNKLYLYKLGQQVKDNGPFDANQGYHALLVNPAFTCTAGFTLPAFPSSSNPAGYQEILDAHMRLSDLSVVSGSDNTYTVHVRVVYGDDDLLNSPSGVGPTAKDVQCKSTSGSQFCAVSDLTTTVQRRL